MPPATDLPSLYVANGAAVRPSLAEANAWCQTFARRNAENFTVASYLLPRHLRQHFTNLYAWCRWADDLADEHCDSEASLAQLADWEDQLQRTFAGDAEHLIHVALAQTIREFDLPLAPFADLISAFRQDQWQSHYATIDDLLDYCRRSANPVGRLVLRLGRCENADNIAWSDSICTGLQLVNFWQDVRRDWTERGRIYLPRETQQRFGVEDDALESGEATAPLRAAIGHEVDRAEVFLQSGWPLVARVSRELRLEVELFIRGGLAVAQAIRRQGCDVLARRPAISKMKKLQLFASTAVRQKIFRRYGARA